MPSQEELLSRLASLESRLQGVEDVQAIHRLKARYAKLVDSRTPHRKVRSQDEINAAARQVAALFTEDGVWDGGKALGIARGREEIYERLRNPSVHFAWHFFVKPEIHVDGDEAQGSWDILSPCTLAGGRAMWMVGVEHDTYRKVADHWLHASMRLETVFMAPYARGWGNSTDVNSAVG